MGLTVGFDATPAVHQGAGIGRYTRQLLAALSDREDATRYKLFYSARGRKRGSLPALDARFQIRSVPVSDRLLNAVWHRAEIPLPVQCLTGAFDLFHSPDFTVPPTAGKPSVLTVHDVAFLTAPECAYPTLRAYLARVVPRSVARATRIIAVSESTRRDVIDHLGADESKVSVVLEGVDERFRPQPTETRAKLTAALGVSQPFILTVGTVEPRKNYARLLEAYAALRARGVTHDLVLVGALGWLYEPILAQRAQLGLEECTRFIQTDDATLVALYNLADAFVYPSLYEGFGMPALEALACGAPVTCSNTSSLPEVVGDAALTFDPTDVEAIAHSLERILSDGALRSELKRRGPQRAASFTWREAANQTVRLYNEVAGA